MTYSQLPFNGQTKIINGVSYVYTSANNSWTVGTGIPSSTEIVYADVVYITSTNGINFSGTVTGSPTISTNRGFTLLTFTGSGTYTA
jgi:hypothetical protein